MTQILRTGKGYALSKIYLSLLAVILSMCLEARAQSPEPSGAVQPGIVPDTIIPLQIGDTIPEYLWHLPLQVVNHPKGVDTITLNDYRGKLIILDFWATWCIPCIRKLGELAELQHNMQDVRILLVNTSQTGREGTAVIRDFFERRQSLRELFSVVNDPVLKKLSGHTQIPHYVWIKEGRVLTVSDSKAVTYDNLNRAAKGFFKGIDYSNDLNTSGKDLFGSSLHVARMGLTPENSIIKNDEGKVIRLHANSATLLMLYTQAYPEYRDILPNCIFIETNQKEMLNMLFDYELVCPPTTLLAALQLMKADLSRYFRLAAQIEFKNLDCWVLDTLETPAPVGRDVIRSTNIYEEDENPKFMRNTPIQSLVQHLNDIWDIPVIDETGHERPVNLNLPVDLHDQRAMITLLGKQGLRLVKTKRELKTLRIVDDSNLQFNLTDKNNEIHN